MRPAGRRARTPLGRWRPPRQDPQLRLDRGRLGGKVLGVGGEQLSRAGIGEATAAVLAEGLEQLVACRAARLRAHGEHGALGEPGQEVEGVPSRRHGLRRSEVEGPGQHRQCGEQRPLVRFEHVVRPADGVVHGAVAGIAPPAHRLQHPEALVEAVGDFGDPDRPRPGGGQLDGQRDPVQPPADLDDQGGKILVEDEGGVGGPGAGDEEGDRGDLGQFAQRHVGGEQVRGPGGEGVHRPEPLTGHGEGLPAGGHDRNGGCLAQDPRRQLGHRFDQVLAVVEHQEAVTGAQQIDDGVLDRARFPEAHVDGRGQCGGRGVLVDDPDQLHDVDTILELTADHAGQLHGHRGLPDTAGPDQGHQPVVADHLDELYQQCLPTDQRLHTDTDRRAAGHAELGGTGRALVDLHHSGDELVALAVHGPDDQLTAAVVTDGPAHRLDPRGQGRLAHEPVTPDGVEQVLLAHDRATVLDQVGEHVEDLRLDPDLLATPSKDDPVEVQLAVSESDHLTDRSRRRWSGSAGGCDPRHPGPGVRASPFPPPAR